MIFGYINKYIPKVKLYFPESKENMLLFVAQIMRASWNLLTQASVYIIFVLLVGGLLKE